MIPFIFPFIIDFDPMERLLLVNFEKDPDFLYIGFEPQVFDDPVNGTGHLIIAWRVDGKVDVYHQSTLKPNPKKYDITGKGLANMIETEIHPAEYTVNEFGVQANYSFRDIQNRSVEIFISEKNPKTRKPFGLLAPMGDAAENPSSMPLVLLHDFYFVRKEHTEIKVEIDGRSHTLDMMPLPLDFSKMYFTRYSPQPLIATLNPAQNDNLKMMQAEIGSDELVSGDYIYKFLWEENLLSIKTLIRNNPVHPVRMDFQPAFPNLSDLPAETKLNGTFKIEGHPSTGSISGVYSIEVNTDGKIELTLIPSGGWKPHITKFSLRLLYTVGKIFKQWPTTYLWQAKVQNIDGNWHIQSDWKRTSKIGQ